MNLKEIKQILDSPQGKELKAYLLSRLGELRDIENVADCKTPTHQAVELKAQRKAFEKLKNILAEIMTIQEISGEKKEKDQFFAI